MSWHMVHDIGEMSHGHGGDVVHCDRVHLIYALYCCGSVLISVGVGLQFTIHRVRATGGSPCACRRSLIRDGCDSGDLFGIVVPEI